MLGCRIEWLRESLLLLKTSKKKFVPNSLLRMFATQAKTAGCANRRLARSSVHSICWDIDVVIVYIALKIYSDTRIIDSF